MKIVVRQVREVRALRTDSVCGANGFRDAHVCRMERSEQRIEHEDLRTDEKLDHFVGNYFCVGYVGQGTNTISKDLYRSVGDGEWKHFDAGDLRWFPVAKGNRAPLRLRCSGKRSNRIVEDVGKAACEPLQCVRWTVHLERRVPSARNRADVVEAVRVVGVIMRVEYSVDAIDSCGDELKAKLRGRVDEKSRAFVCFDKRANSVTLVSRIGRVTDSAAAADLRNTKTRSGAEERQLHASAPKATVTRFPLSKGSSFPERRMGHRQ